MIVVVGAVVVFFLLMLLAPSLLALFALHQMPKDVRYCCRKNELLC